MPPFPAWRSARPRPEPAGGLHSTLQLISPLRVERSGPAWWRVEGDQDHVAAHTVGDAPQPSWRRWRHRLRLSFWHTTTLELVGVGPEVALHDLLAAGLREGAGLAVKDLPFGMLGGNLVEALGAAGMAAGGAHGAFDHQDVGLRRQSQLLRPATPRRPARPRQRLSVPMKQEYRKDRRSRCGQR